MVIYFKGYTKVRPNVLLFFHTQDFKELFFNPLKKKSFFSSAGIRLKAKNNLSKEVLKTLQRTSPTSAEKLGNYTRELCRKDCRVIIRLQQNVKNRTVRTIAAKLFSGGDTAISSVSLPHSPKQCAIG